MFGFFSTNDEGKKNREAAHMQSVFRTPVFFQTILKMRSWTLVELTETPVCFS
jgi:hypothetical protein